MYCVSVCLFVSFISAFILPFSCDVTDVCVSVDLVFCGVFCVVYRNYTLKILMLFLIAAHLQPPRKYLTIKFYTQQFIIKSNHHHQQIHCLQYTSGDWAGRQAVRFCEILISVHDAILFYCKYHFHSFISKLIIGTICKDFCFSKWQKI